MLSQGPLVRDPTSIRLAMLGMVEGNGHPYSWSAIFNGYDPVAMAECPYPVIPRYLGNEPPEAFGFPGARVTHVWCDQRRDSEQVARAARIPKVVARPEEVIGEVDAVLIATDIGSEHVARARPFLEAGIPVFIDKPLCDSVEDLRWFLDHHRKGRRFLSSSCLRYCREYSVLSRNLSELGDLRLITMTMSKTWERYGIHALEGVYPILPPGGWLDLVNTGEGGSNMVHVRHGSGVEVHIAAIHDLQGAFGCLNLHGTRGSTGATFGDTFAAFKAQLSAFVDYLRDGKPPFPFEETVELITLLIAGIRSRNQGGRRVSLSEIHEELRP
ncbi:MAG: hypothetical protein GHCLOJNM_03678 [bacterium]|nr:hypothetical protein [bacterium]